MPVGFGVLMGAMLLRWFFVGQPPAQAASPSPERVASESGGRVRTTVALYTPPGPVWQRLARSARAFPDVEVTAIISPRHSDNDSPFAGDDIEKYLAHNQTWLSAMESLRTAGIRIQHYLHLRNLTCPRRGQCRQTGKTSRSYCLLESGACVPKTRCCNSLENVSAIINASVPPPANIYCLAACLSASRCVSLRLSVFYKLWAKQVTHFPEDGLFLDNGPFLHPEPDSPFDTLEKVRAFEAEVFHRTQRGAGSGGRRVTSNGLRYHDADTARRLTGPGLDGWTLANLNETFMFEDSGDPEVVANHQQAPRSRFSVLVSSVANASQMRRVVDRFWAAGYGDICVLGVMNASDEYRVLPSFWEDEMAYLARKSRMLNAQPG